MAFCLRCWSVCSSEEEEEEEDGAFFASVMMIPLFAILERGEDGTIRLGTNGIGART